MAERNDKKENQITEMESRCYEQKGSDITHSKSGFIWISNILVSDNLINGHRGPVNGYKCNCGPVF